jgi:hypothetical protein
MNISGMERQPMNKGLLLSATGSILFIILCTAAAALPEVTDVDGRSGFIDLGRDILTIDYMEVLDNGVITSGTDYPYGRIWVILYEPIPYENRDLVQDDQWKRNYEIDRFEIPGPSPRERWANDDAVVFRNLGIYDWAHGELDRIVFRIIVEEPSDGSDVLTLMWGTIHEDDSYVTLEYTAWIFISGRPGFPRKSSDGGRNSTRYGSYTRSSRTVSWAWSFMCGST